MTSRKKPPLALGALLILGLVAALWFSFFANTESISRQLPLAAKPATEPGLEQAPAVSIPIVATDKISSAHQPAPDVSASSSPGLLPKAGYVQPASTKQSVVPAPAPPVALIKSAAQVAEVRATRTMYMAHTPLRAPELTDPDSATNRRILQTMVEKALTRQEPAR